MRKIIFIVALTICASADYGHAMAVFDGSNLAQNIVAAREAITHTQNQIQQLTNQLNQYKRMLQDAANPGQWMWGDIQDTLDQLRGTMNSLKSISGQAGGINSYLEVYGTTDDYISRGSLYGTGNQSLYVGDYQGAALQKDSADELLQLIGEQQEALDRYADELERLKSRSSNAQGQQEAIQAGNEFASMQIQLLSQIHTLLMAQNTMMAAQVETENNRQSQQRVGTAIKMGQSQFTQKETAKGGASFTPYQ